MRASEGRTFRTVVVLLAGILLVGCGTDAPVSPDEGCTEEYPHSLNLFPETLAEQAATDGFAACANPAGTAVSLHNGSLAVWIVDRPVSPLTYPSPTPSTRATLLAETVGYRSIPGILLAPEEDLVVAAQPDQLHLTLDPGVTAVWQTTTLFDDMVVGRLRDTLANQAATGSPMRRSIVDCALAAYDAIDLLPAADQRLNQAPALFIADSYGLVDQTGSCAQSLRLAQPPGAPALLDDLAARVAEPRWRQATDDLVRAALYLR